MTCIGQCSLDRGWGGDVLNTLKDGNSRLSGVLVDYGGSCVYKEVSHGGIEYLEQIHALQLCSSSCAQGCAGSTGAGAPKGPCSLSYFQTLMATWHVSSFMFSCLPPNLFILFFSRREGNPGDSLHQPQSKAGQSFLSHQPYQADSHTLPLA